MYPDASKACISGCRTPIAAGKKKSVTKEKKWRLRESLLLRIYIKKKLALFAPHPFFGASGSINQQIKILLHTRAKKTPKIYAGELG